MSQELVFGERRIHQRKECILPVDLNDFKSFSRGNLRNISQGGAFVEMSTGQPAPIGLDVAVTIPYQLKSRRITIIGRVVRVNPKGMGLSFSRLPQTG